MKSAIQTVEVSYFLHATEDMARVSSAVSELVGAGAPPEVEEMTGHFGNVIRRVTFRSHGAQAAESFARLAERFPPELKAEVVKEMDLFLDEHSSLFLRLDKQKFLGGEFVRGSKDAIRIRVKPRAFMKGEARAILVNQLEAR